MLDEGCSCLCVCDKEDTYACSITARQNKTIVQNYTTPGGHQHHALCRRATRAWPSLGGAILHTCAGAPAGPQPCHAMSICDEEYICDYLMMYGSMQFALNRLMLRRREAAHMHHVRTYATTFCRSTAAAAVGWGQVHAYITCLRDHVSICRTEQCYLLIVVPGTDVWLSRCERFLGVPGRVSQEGRLRH